MKRVRKKCSILFLSSIISCLISSISVFFIPFGSTKNIISIILGLVFWVGILFSYACFMIVWFNVKTCQNYQKIKIKYKPGYRTFFTKPIAFVSDCVFILALLLVIFGNTVVRLNEPMQLFLMFGLLFTFHIHFMFNGRVYRYLFLVNERKENEESE